MVVHRSTLSRFLTPQPLSSPTRAFILPSCFLALFVLSLSLWCKFALFVSFFLSLCVSLSFSFFSSRPSSPFFSTLLLLLPSFRCVTVCSSCRDPSICPSLYLPSCVPLASGCCKRMGLPSPPSSRFTHPGKWITSLWEEGKDTLTMKDAVRIRNREDFVINLFLAD